MEILLEFLTRGALALSLSAPLGPADAIDWQPDLGGALEKAKREGRPLFVAINMDGEEANDFLAERHYRDRAVVARSRDFVCLVASTFDHAAKGECPRFGAVTCLEHQQVERQVRARYLGGVIRVVAPQHLVLSPDGEILRQREWALSVDDLVAWMQGGLRDVDLARQRDPSVPFDEETWKRLLNAARSPVRLRQVLPDLVHLDRTEAQALLERRYGEAKDEATRVEVLRALGAPGYRRALPFLLDRLEDPAEAIRRHAAVSLEIVGDAGAVEALVAASKGEKDERVLKEFVRALARLGPDRGDVAEIVSRFARDPRDLVRGNALVAAADLADRTLARNLIREALSDSSTDVLGCAVYGLVLVGEASDLEALDALGETVRDLRLRLLLQVARRRIFAGPGLDVSPELGVALAAFAHDDVPHDGTWPPPPLPGR